MNFVWYISHAAILSYDIKAVTQGDQDKLILQGKGKHHEVCEILVIYSSGHADRWSVDKDDYNLESAIDIFTNALTRKTLAHIYNTGSPSVRDRNDDLITLAEMAAVVFKYEESCED